MIKNRLIWLLVMFCGITGMALYFNYYLGQDKVYIQLFYIFIVLIGIYFHRYVIPVAASLGIFRIMLEYLNIGFLSPIALVQGLMMLIIAVILYQLRADLFVQKKRLLVSDRKYSFLAEDVDAYICTFWPDGRLNYINSTYRELLQRNAAELELIGNNTWLDETFRQDLFKKYNILTFNQPRKTYEKMVNIDGKDCWMHWSDRAYYNHLGEVFLYQSIGIDITEQKQKEKDLEKEEKFLRTTLLSIGDGVIYTDKQGKISLLNTVAEQLTGWKQDEAIGKSHEQVFKIIDELTRKNIESPVQKVLKTGNATEISNYKILISKEGIERPIEENAAPIKDSEGEVIGVVVVFKDFAEKQQKQREIEYLSNRDTLTGLYNPNGFIQELQKLNIEENLPLTSAIADINGLKLANDAFGYSFGDNLIQRVAEIMQRECPQDATIARVGGGQFAILLPNTDDNKGKMVVTRLKEIIAAEKEMKYNLSVSFGLSTILQVSEDIESIVKKAEDDMYGLKLYESSSMRSQTVQLIINTLYETNEREEQHSERVGLLCEAIGVGLGLNGDRLNKLRTAGLMHDIGKIGIEEKILNKPGKLSDSEWVEIKRHPETGYRILSSVKEFAKLSEYVLAHHERWDGNGYPKGLKGEEIPLEARIISIADTYDAMTSDRPYRKALNKTFAIEEIRRNAGKQFDPNIAGVFIEKVIQKTS